MDSLDPSQGTDTGRESDVVNVDTSDESDTLGSSTSIDLRAERPSLDGQREIEATIRQTNDVGCTNEHAPSDDVSANQGDSSSDLVEEEDTQDLTDNTHGIVDTVDQKRRVLETDTRVNLSFTVSI